MATNYANETLTAAIQEHLLDSDVIPPTTAVSKLARELARVCLTELETAGLGSAAIEHYFAPVALKAKAHGAE